MAPDEDLDTAAAESDALPWESITTDTSDEGEEPEEPEEASRPAAKGRSYTWLHLLVLCLVAFVLGVVIYLLLDRSGAVQAEALAGFSTFLAVGW